MAYIRKIRRNKGFVYKVEIAFSDLTKRSKSFRTREEALRWGRTQDDTKSTQRSFGVTPVMMTFDEFFERFLEEYAKVHHSAGWITSDLAMYRKYIAPILGNRLLREIHPLDIQRVVQEMLKNGLAKSYTNRVRALLHKVFAEAVKTYRYLPHNPVSSVRPLKEDPYEAPHLRRDQAMAFLAWADSHPYGIAFHLAIQLGLREGEVLGLKWDAIDLSTRSIAIKRKWNRKIGVMDEFTKGRRHRYLGIYPDGLLERLRDQRARYPNAEFVACDQNGEILNFMQLDRAVRAGRKALGFETITFHGLRHTYATLYMESGGDLYDLQLLMGHQSARTTERYRHRNPEYMKSRCKILDLYSAQIPPKTETALLRLISGTP